MYKNNKSLSQSSSAAAKNSSPSDERRISLNLSRRIGGVSNSASISTTDNSAKLRATSAPSKFQATPKASASSQKAQVAPSKVSITLTQQSASFSTTSVKSEPKVHAKTQEQHKLYQTQEQNAQATSPKSTTPSKTQESVTTTQEYKSVTPVISATSADTDTNKTDSNNDNKDAQASKPSSKGSYTPPWMVQYQKKVEASSSDDSNVHIDLTSKTKQEQSDRERLEKQRAELENEFSKALEFATKFAAKKANGPKSTKKQEQRLKEIEEYTPTNFFNLDLFAFQKSFDNIDKSLGDYLNEHFDFINSLIKDDSIEDFVKLHLNEDNLDFFTSKKSKYKHKQRLTEEQLESAITEYLRFKYTGVFKAVCMYQLFCEQFRVEIFNQLEKQCRDFSSEHDVVAMGDLQRLIDDVEPIEVAANKLMRLSLSESQIVSSDMSNSIHNTSDIKHGIDRAVALRMAKDVQSDNDELRSKVNKYSDFSAQLFDFTPEDAGNDPELQALADKVHVDMISQEDLEKLGCTKLSAEFSELFTKAAMSDRTNVLPYHCKQLDEICSILSVYDGYYPSDSNQIENLDDGMLSTGVEWASEIGSHVNVPGATKGYQFLDWVLYWRLETFSDAMKRGNRIFIDADECISEDQNYIFACPESNFKRNLEQLNLCFRQIVGKRDALYRYQRPDSDKDINVYLSEYTNVTDNSFALIVQFVLGLSLTERLIFSSVLNSVDSSYETVLSPSYIRTKFDSKNDDYKKISDDDIAQFCSKLLDTVLVERLLASNRSCIGVDDSVFSVKVRITPTLIKNLDDTKQMLRMYATVSSLTKRMNQELLYINPALRTMFECCETLMHNRSVSTTSNMLTKIEQILQDEIVYNKLRNRYIEMMMKEDEPLDNGINKDILIKAMYALPMSIKSRMEIERFAEYLDLRLPDDDDDDEEDNSTINPDFLVKNFKNIKDTFSRLNEDINPENLDDANSMIHEIMRNSDTPAERELANAVLGVLNLMSEHKKNH